MTLILLILCVILNTFSIMMLTLSVKNNTEAIQNLTRWRK